jgi:uncharacterized circularly permuted ATP-grasp superfamily protein
MGAWREGRVALVNAPGCGVADDKSIYPYVPDMVRFFLAEEPLLPNVPTYRCADEADRGYVLGNLDSLVVKPANESGGYGISIGPRAGAAELAELRQRIEEDPKGWVGQPVVALSTAPTLSGRRVVPRHVDLRPFTLYGPNGCYVTPGGLTRVALREGSLVVNSSQGGGSKDTWIVDDGSAPRKARRTARPRRTASSRTAATLDLGSPAPGQSPGNAARAEPRLPRPTGRDQ